MKERGIDIPEPEMIGVNSLKPDPQNIKKPSKDKLKALMKSIEKFGFIVPVITNRTFLVADGHQRLEAAKKLKMKHVPVIRLDVDEVDRKLLRQVITKLQWELDEEMDYAELKELVESGNLAELSELIDADPTDLLKLLEQDLTAEEDDFQEPKEPKYKIERGEALTGEKASKNG